MSRRRRRLVSFIVSLLLLIGVILLIQWVWLWLLDRSYLEWYLMNGALIGLATSFFALVAGDFKENRDFVAFHPLDYFAASLQLSGILLYAVGAGTAVNKNKAWTYGRHQRQELGEPWLVQFIADFVLLLAWLLVVMILMLGWLILIVPVQYFVNLICGAPARHFIDSGNKAIASYKFGRLKVKTVSEAEELEEGWWDASISNKPIAFTALLSVLFFTVLRLLLLS